MFLILLYTTTDYPNSYVDISVIDSKLKSVTKNSILKWEQKNLIMKYVEKLKIVKTNFGN